MEPITQEEFDRIEKQVGFTLSDHARKIINACARAFLTDPDPVRYNVTAKDLKDLKSKLEPLIDHLRKMQLNRTSDPAIDALCRYNASFHRKLSEMIFAHGFKVRKGPKANVKLNRLINQLALVYNGETGSKPTVRGEFFRFAKAVLDRLEPKITDDQKRTERLYWTDESIHRAIRHHLPFRF